MKEADLYPPLKEYLINLGYEVKSEIQGCDVVAIRGDNIVIVVELKLSLNLTILLQAVDRLQITDTVYIGVPDGMAVLVKRRKQIVKLLRMLGLGLIVIDPKTIAGNVDILCEPAPYKPRQVKKRTLNLLTEFKTRLGDPNVAGRSTRKGIVTAYRQKSIAIAEYLLHLGATKASVIAESLVEPKTRTILYNNVYGWFERLGKGVYKLSPRGMAELADWVKRNNL
ncbi:MAG: hypothetical protein GY786_19035 [Proteobacteria bacterium]|nr:hypothetical protein [Pseudomonadota bacterium]